MNIVIIILKLLEVYGNTIKINYFFNDNATINNFRSTRALFKFKQKLIWETELMV